MEISFAARQKRRAPVTRSFDLAIRLAGWLRGTHSAKILRRMRIRRPLAVRVERLVRMHPFDDDVDPNHKANVYRLIKR